MGYYYKYEFTSPEGVFAIVKEELKSYFDTGAVDDLMFPTYVNKCLSKLGRATSPIYEDILYVDDFQARLPDNFIAVREAWMCTEIAGYPYQSPSSFYSQAASSTTIQVAPMIVNGVPCVEHECYDPACDMCMPQMAQAVYKTNNEVNRTYVRQYMLKPGNISARKSCSLDYMSGWETYCQSSALCQSTPYSSDFDSFDIRDNKFVTNFRKGVVNLVFYGDDSDELGMQMIPDNYRIKEYIELFIKYKVFETLTNQVNDETYKQLAEKMVHYKQLADEAYIMADVEIKKQTIWDKQRRIKKQLHNLDRYELPNRSRRFLGGYK